MSISIESITACWQRHRASFVAHARTYTNDTDAAEDLTQDLVTTAIDAAPTYRGSADLRQIRAWLLGILNNLCRRARARHQRDTAGLERLAAHLEADQGTLPRGQLYDAAIWLLRVANLDATQTCILRARMDGHTLRQIAITHSLDVRTVRHIINDAVQALRACPYNDLPGADLSQQQIKSGERVTIYHRPQRTGAGLARQQLARLK